MARPPVRVFFDTTVLCSAILNLDGLCMRLLEWAQVGVLKGIITTEVVAEFDRNCRIGLGGHRLDDEDIAEFCALLSPLLDLAEIRQGEVGRAMGPTRPILDAGLVRIIQAPIGLPAVVTQMLDAGTLALKDPFDLHVVAAALADDCRFLCSLNTRDLPDGLIVDTLEFIKPERLHRLAQEW